MCQNKSNEMDIFRIQLTMVFVTERASAKACTCFSWVIIIIINPRRACAARVTVQCSWFPCMYVCVYVCMCVCVRSNLPPHTLESQKRDTNGFIAIRELFFILTILLEIDDAA